MGYGGKKAVTKVMFSLRAPAVGMRRFVVVDARFWASPLTEPTERNNTKIARREAVRSCISQTEKKEWKKDGHGACQSELFLLLRIIKWTCFFYTPQGHWVCLYLCDKEGETKNGSLPKNTNIATPLLLFLAPSHTLFSPLHASFSSTFSLK